MDRSISQNTSPPVDSSRSSSFRFSVTPRPLFNVPKSTEKLGLGTNVTGFPAPFGAPVTRGLTQIAKMCESKPKKSSPTAETPTEVTTVMAASGLTNPILATIRRLSTTHVNRASYAGRKSLIPVAERAPSTWNRLPNNARDRACLLRNMNFQFLSHQHYHPMIIEAIYGQMTLIEQFTETISSILDARAEYVKLAKKLCTVASEQGGTSEALKEQLCPGSIRYWYHEWLEDMRFELEAEEVVIERSREDVIAPLRDILSHRYEHIERLNTFRCTIDDSLHEASDLVAELHCAYSDVYQANRDTAQTRAIQNILTSHNEYVLHLHMTNTMKEQYHAVVLPQLMSELEDVVRSNTSTFAHYLETFLNLHVNMVDQIATRLSRVFARLKEQSIEADVVAMVERLNSNHNWSHWQPIEYLPPDSDCPELLQSDTIIVHKLIRSALQIKFNGLKRQFAELSSFMQQNRDVVDTLETLERRTDGEAQTVGNICKLQDDIFRKNDEIRRAGTLLAGVAAQVSDGF